MSQTWFLKIRRTDERTDESDDFDVNEINTRGMSELWFYSIFKSKTQTFSIRYRMYSVSS